MNVSRPMNLVTAILEINKPISFQLRIVRKIKKTTNSVMKVNIASRQPPLKRTKTPAKSLSLKGVFSTRFPPNGRHWPGIEGNIFRREFSIMNNPAFPNS